ncbi:hypothetical protein Cst_c20390 [Thermoclostridium stercorarium subsp. stercorarium DSM 8532]|uniref:Uncharacterized protein n=1 Tax=Thermoclostridium stercorarium (strain ATCC 35414 / DSM 8532 / NCIMB 11754) TaxID=1121335 RepID=L7VQD0_THES1|nr:hypothetical protein Cst_c20390 [Thermoclostridium stercorarium subsp. stercorarium DSM 8532]
MYDADAAGLYMLCRSMYSLFILIRIYFMKRRVSDARI